MTQKTTIEDGKGSGNKVSVGTAGELSVVVHGHPPLDERITTLPFRQYFTDDGTASGDNDMVVNASLALPQDFSIEASQDFDIYIKTLSVQITDPGATLEEFGALPELTNGVKWIWKTAEEGDYELHDGITTNLEFIKTALGQPSFGTGTEAFKADIKGGAGDDTFLPVINLNTTFGLVYGVRLRKGTKDSIIFRVQDNLTGINTFNIIGYGLRFSP